VAHFRDILGLCGDLYRVPQTSDAIEYCHWWGFWRYAANFGMGGGE
jgi:hypothetical protein